ncbi:MAG: hypothetical protein Q8R76_08895 [Candidatus Omnitrophota bacterium]|nr:hypothetical protein [Candidatus Omnitrophota bacterium]
MLSISATGCQTLRNEVQSKVLPANAEALRYELPYDLTYLRTMEALEGVDGWELESTEKTQGILRVYNTQFRAYDDADQRSVTVLVTRDTSKFTVVTLAPQSQHVLGGGKLLEAINFHVSREL